MNKAKLQDATVAAMIALLAETFPRCFSVYEARRQPLKLKIHLEIQAALDGAITPAELHRALGMYCSNRAYLEHTRAGAWRLDLDGNPAGTVTADEEAHAKATLAGIRAKERSQNSYSQGCSPTSQLTTGKVPLAARRGESVPSRTERARNAVALASRER